MLFYMKTYDSIADLLNFEGPSLQDYVSAEQLDQLVAGTLAPAAIADEYLADLEASTYATVTTNPEDTRVDLLAWIRSEIEIAIDQRNEDNRDETLAKLATFDDKAHAEKMKLIAQARRQNATKAAIAQNLGISRPTLDKLLGEQEDRALFDRAAFELIRAGVPSNFEKDLTQIIGIRDTTKQADTLISAHHYNEHRLRLNDRAKAIVDHAVERANEVR
jgi:predicted DNA-binding transcriptional regulator AlpA